MVYTIVPTYFLFVSVPFQSRLMAACPMLSQFHMVSPRDPYWDHCFSCCTPLICVILFMLGIKNHHLFADDTQLYISFNPENFKEAMSALSNAFQSISSWMSANLLVLNTTKTEILLIGGPLPKLASYSLLLSSA